MYHAQRQHIILSLDALLYQLHTLSFILSPSIWSYLCRLASQFQCSKPRDLDATASRSLRFFFANILLFNASSVWSHATQGAVEGRTVVLDFIGLSYVPSKLQLLSLDVLIILLQLVLTTIAYEVSLSENETESNTHDILLPIPSSRPSESSGGLSTSISMPSDSKFYSSSKNPSYVIDLHLAPIISRLRNPPLPRSNGADTSLPLPNTTPWSPGSGSHPQTSSQIRRSAAQDSEASSRIPGELTT